MISDEYNLKLQQVVTSRVFDKTRKYLWKDNNEANRSAIQYEISQTMSELLNEGAIMPKVTDSKGNVLELDGFDITTLPYDKSRIDLEPKWRLL